MSSDSLNRLIAMANIQVEIEEDVGGIEAQLKKRKEDLRKISEVDLPDLMSELGISEFKLSSGKVVKISEVVVAKIPEGRSPEAFDWLKARNFGGLIKSVVTAQFGKDEVSKAEQLVDNLHDHGVAAEVKRSIHPGTLKAFVKERLEHQESIPFDLFGIVVLTKAVIS